MLLLSSLRSFFSRKHALIRSLFCEAAGRPSSHTTDRTSGSPVPTSLFSQCCRFVFPFFRALFV